MVAIDGTSLDVPDDPATQARPGKGSNQHTAVSGYPQILLVTLVACGTREDVTRPSVHEGRPRLGVRRG
ncbi:MAG: hypothetical protein ACLQDY_27890 [Streptosporangiaceae bacterium]